MYYQYRVVAKNTVGYLDGAGPGWVPGHDGPVGVWPGGRAIAAPTNLAATLLAGPPRVSLTWTDNATNETRFNVERSTDGVNFAVVGTAPARNNTGGVLR